MTDVTYAIALSISDLQCALCQDFPDLSVKPWFWFRSTTSCWILDFFVSFSAVQEVVQDLSTHDYIRHRKLCINFLLLPVSLLWGNSILNTGSNWTQGYSLSPWEMALYPHVFLFRVLIIKLFYQNILLLVFITIQLFEE